jgi:mRNA interferase RelE/StbE
MKLVITEPAEKDIARLDEITRRRIFLALEKMVINKRMVDLKKLKGNVDLWRLRIGEWRVILQITGQEPTAYILRIKHRREAYKR